MGFLAVILVGLLSIARHVVDRKKEDSNQRGRDFGQREGGEKLMDHPVHATCCFTKFSQSLT